jgi:hypothetical protein
MASSSSIASFAFFSVTLRPLVPPRRFCAPSSLRCVAALEGSDLIAELLVEVRRVGALDEGCLDRTDRRENA